MAQSGIVLAGDEIHIESDTVRNLINDYDVLFSIVKSGASFMLERGALPASSDEQIFMRSLTGKALEFKKAYIDPLRAK